MGNKNNRNDSTLPTFNPKDEINTEENKLNLIPSTYINFGLYHSSEVLKDIYPKIVMFTMENQMKFSDAMTRRYALNKYFLNKQNLDLPIEELVKNINATIIGNFACLTYHNGLESKYGLYYTRIINYLKTNYM
jgi:hypothetical protein